MCVCTCTRAYVCVHVHMHECRSVKSRSQVAFPGHLLSEDGPLGSSHVQEKRSAIHSVSLPLTGEAGGARRVRAPRVCHGLQPLASAPTSSSSPSHNPRGHVFTRLLLDVEGEAWSHSLETVCRPRQAHPAGPELHPGLPPSLLPSFAQRQKSSGQPPGQTHVAVSE